METQMVEELWMQEPDIDFEAWLIVQEDDCTSWMIEAKKNCKVIDTASYEAINAGECFEEEPNLYKLTRTKEFQDWFKGLEEEFCNAEK